jgi:hypothetical protein
MQNLWQNQAGWWGLCLFVCVVSSLLGACSSPSARGAASSSTTVLSLAVGKTLAAIGVKPPGENGSGADDAVWQDRRIAFGLTNLLAESFYDTGKFRLVEEKNLSQWQLIEELVDLSSSPSRPELSDLELASIGRRLAIDLLAYGRVGSTRLSGQRTVFGPLGRYQQRLRITIEACLHEVSSQKTLCREGEGMAQQEGVGVVYEFRNDRPDFEKTAAGLATKQAVTSAVQALMASIRFSP